MLRNFDNPLTISKQKPTRPVSGRGFLQRTGTGLSNGPAYAAMRCATATGTEFAARKQCVEIDARTVVEPREALQARATACAIGTELPLPIGVTGDSPHIVPHRSSGAARDRLIDGAGEAAAEAPVPIAKSPPTLSNHDG